jgi:hypothetical protein
MAALILSYDPAYVVEPWNSTGGGGTPVPTGKILLVPVGDSRTASPTGENPWPDQLRAALPAATYTVTNKAVGGSTSTDCLNVCRTDVFPLDRTGYSLAILHVYTGVNAWLNKTNRDTAQVKADYEAICREAVAAGYLVIFATETRVNTLYVNFGPQQDECNQYIRDNALSWGASLVEDLEREYTLQNPKDQLVWKDAVHLQAYANTILARRVKRSMDSLLIARNLPTFAYTWSVDSVYEGGLSSLTSESVAWADLASASATGSTLTLSAGGTGHSTKALGASAAGVRGFLEFTIGAAGGGSVGFSDSATANKDDSDGIFNLRFQNDGQVQPFGSVTGPYMPLIPYQGGDIFRIQVERGETGSQYNQYTWFKNGVRVDTYLGIVPTGLLQIDTSCNGNPLVLGNAKIAGANLVVVGAPGAQVPTLASISPSSGVVGDVLTFTGTNFTGAATVSFGGVTSTSVVVASATQLTATIPAGASSGTAAVTTAGGTSNGKPYTVTAGPRQQDGDASLYVEQAGEPVTWTNLEYATANGSSLSFQYVVSHANSTRAIGPSSAALRGFYEHTVDPQSANAGLGLATRQAGVDENVQALYAVISTYTGGYAIRLNKTPNASYLVQGGDVIRVQIGQSGYSLFINKEYKNSFSEPIETGNLQMTLQGNGDGSFDSVKIWGPNLVTL